MSILKMNLRSGVSSFASFAGIGRGLGKPKARSEPRFQGIGANRPRASARGKAAAEYYDENGDPIDDPDSYDGQLYDENGQPVEDDDDGADDQALDDDDYGADAPADDDSQEDLEAKRARRVARRARRMKAEDDQQPAPAPPARKPKSPPPQEEQDDEDEDEEDPTTEMRGNSPLAKARRRERARCAAIFASEAALKNPNLAGHLAFNTNMPRAAAIATLAQGGAAGRGGVLKTAMADFAGARPGAPPVEKTQAQVTASGWDAAFDDVTSYRNPRR